MKFSAVVALLAAPLLALAQENPFAIPDESLNTAAGSTVTLTWNPTTSGTISLILRNGLPSALNPGEAIAENIPNSGSFTWTVPNDIIRGSDYAIEIRPTGSDDDDDSNFTGPFVIDSTNNSVRPTASTSGTATTGTTTGTGSTTGTSTTGSATGSTTGTATTTNTSQTTGSSSTGSSSSGSMTTRSSTASAPFQSATTTSQGSAARATAAAGMMGLVALGALAL